MTEGAESQKQKLGKQKAEIGKARCPIVSQSSTVCNIGGARLLAMRFAFFKLFSAPISQTGWREVKAPLFGVMFFRGDNAGRSAARFIRTP
jgi:hypothetical protein